MDKMSIQTFVINLKRALRRKEYMQELLEQYDYLDIKFIPAVDGHILTDDYVADNFDESQSYKRYGRRLNRGEIGCTLSHISCYRELLEGSENYALIMEDDISILKDISVLPSLMQLIDHTKPTVLLLSGDYWYTKDVSSQNGLDVVKVYDAVGAYAYVINKAAAQLILSKYSLPSHVADHWMLYREIGVNILAIKPYLIDANISGMESTIKQDFFGENRREMHFADLMKVYWYALIKKMLLKFGHFVSKIRRSYNEVN